MPFDTPLSVRQELILRRIKRDPESIVLALCTEVETLTHLFDLGAIEEQGFGFVVTEHGIELLRALDRRYAEIRARYPR